jgi:hypothetical protein
MNRLQMVRIGYFFILITACILFVIGCSNEEPKKQEPPQHHSEQVKIEKDSKSLLFDHVHGLGFTSDGKRLLVAAHDGLRQYKNGKWSRPPGDLHDYMGFQVVDKGFYSSGHPAPGDELPNPLGVVFSSDTGKTLELINLLGKTDLHVFAVGYQSYRMFAYNEYPNDVMPEKAYYVSQDQGKTWSKAEARGLTGEPISATIHPQNIEQIAVLTEAGLHFSNDGGTSFELSSMQNVTSSMFSLDGKEFLYTKLSGGVLYSLSVDDLTKKLPDRPLPTINGQVVYYLAQNPTQPKQFAFSTNTNHVYITTDNGLNWKMIAQAGSTKNH